LTKKPRGDDFATINMEKIGQRGQWTFKVYFFTNNVDGGMFCHTWEIWGMLRGSPVIQTFFRNDDFEVVASVRDDAIRANVTFVRRWFGNLQSPNRTNLMEAVTWLFDTQKLSFPLSPPPH
jgi:hypothetical protein